MAVRFTDRDLVATLVDKIDDSVITCHNDLERGLGHEDYLKVVGQIRGLRLAREMAIEIRKKGEEA